MSLNRMKEEWNTEMKITYNDEMRELEEKMERIHDMLKIPYIGNRYN